jgi:hypothetical protein
MTDYSKTKIYKIESHLGDKIYVGSTAKQYLSQRLQQHKNSYKRWKDGKCGKVTSYLIFEEYGVDNCQIVLIEEFSCTSKDAKNAREGHFIKTLDCVNKIVIGRSRKESQDAYIKSEKGKEVLKKYQESDKYKEVQKKYQESDKYKETIQKYQESDKYKEAQKKYHESDKGKEALQKSLKKYQETDKGKEARKKAQKQYYERKKAEKLEQQKQSEPIII